MARRPATVVLVAGAAAGLAVGAVMLRRRRRRWDFAGRTVVIAGGSRGLGLEIARILVDEGAAVALLARDAQELELAAASLRERGGVATTHVCDVRERAQVDAAIAEVAADAGRIDALFNVAGVIQVGPLAEMDADDFREAMDVHFWGPLHAMRAVAPHMERAGGGRIVNVSSIGGKVAVPHLAPYTASKFALTGLSDALRAELAPAGIRVTTVVPGLMRTGSQAHVDFRGRERSEDAWFTSLGVLPLLSTDSARAARRIVEACRHGDPELTLTLPAWLLARANAFAPGIVAAAMRVANRVLPSSPRPADAADTWRTPAPLARRADEAARRNNELRGEAG